MSHEAKPYSKSSQLARTARRYRRKIASAKGWQRIADEKLAPCRVCGDNANNGRLHGLIHLHHLVFREDGGDDVAENIVPLCPHDHDAVHRREPGVALVLMLTLTEAEYGYMRRRGGADYPERAYGLVYAR